MDFIVWKEGEGIVTEYEIYESLKMDYLALRITSVDILNGAAYLFEKVSDNDNQHWKVDLELEELREVLRLEENKSE